MTNDQYARRSIGSDVMVITPGDTIDNSTVKQFAQEIESSLTSGYRSLVIDMNNLRFLSSAGVGIIFTYVRKFRAKGGDIVLCNVPAAIFYVLSELDLADYLSIAQDLQAATAACGNAP